MALTPAPRRGPRAHLPPAPARPLPARAGLSVTYISSSSRRGRRRTHRVLARWTTTWWLELGIVLLVLAGAYRLVTLPLHWLGGYWLPRRFGLLHQPFRRWLWDAVKAGLIGGMLGLLAVLIIYALLRVTPWWWLWGAAIFLAGYALLALVAPIWLVPLFYRPPPLPDGELLTRLLALARRVGVPVTACSWWTSRARAAPRTRR